MPHGVSSQLGNGQLASAQPGLMPGVRGVGDSPASVMSGGDVPEAAAAWGSEHVYFGVAAGILLQ